EIDRGNTVRDLTDLRYDLFVRRVFIIRPERFNAIVGAHQSGVPRTSEPQHVFTNLEMPDNIDLLGKCPELGDYSAPLLSSRIGLEFKEYDVPDHWTPQVK